MERRCELGRIQQGAWSTSNYDYLGNQYTQSGSWNQESPPGFWVSGIGATAMSAFPAIDTINVTASPTATLRLRWRGTTKPPTSVRVVVRTEAYCYIQLGYGDADDYGDASGTLTTGLQSHPFSFHEPWGDADFVETASLSLKVDPVTKIAQYRVPMGANANGLTSPEGDMTLSTGFAAQLSLPSDGPFKPSKLEFTSGYPGVTDWDTDYDNVGTEVAVGGWQGAGPAAWAYPVAQQWGQQIGADLTYTLQYTNIAYDLGGVFNYGAANSFPLTHLTSPANVTPIVTSFTAASSLESKIYSFDWSISWTCTPANPNTSLVADTEKNTFFVTKAPPLNGEVPTLKRLRWSCFYALNSTTDEEVADGLWNGLASWPIRSSGTGNVQPGHEWHLLDLGSDDQGVVSGSCIQQAILMKRACNLLGVPATYAWVHASNDADVTYLKEELFTGLATIPEDQNRPMFLFLNFGSGAAAGWNQFEGVCQAAGKVYAVWSKHKKATMLHMLNGTADFLGDSDTGISQEIAGQYWIFIKEVRSVQDLPPVQPYIFLSWTFDHAANMPPVPLPGG